MSGISDPICNENYHTIALGRDRKFHVCSNFRCEIVFHRNTRPDEIGVVRQLFVLVYVVCLVIYDSG